MKYIYLDNAATTKVKPEVLEAMMPYLSETYGNPSSLHTYGQVVREAVEESRAKVAKAINAQPIEIIFTSGGTEADNMAIAGVMRRFEDGHLITSKIEHHAVLHVAEALEKEGYEVTYLDVDDKGLVNPEDLRKAMKPNTRLVSIMFANNEIGTVQDIKELASIAKAGGALFHTDAVQAMGNIKLDVKELGIDLMSISGHKIHAPKGVGALYVRKGVRLKQLFSGGAHEKGRRPGTENVASIIGFGRAVELSQEDLEGHIARMTEMRDLLISRVLKEIDHSRLNGHPTKRLPGNVHFCFEFIEGEALLLSLDAKGIAGSSGSACTSGELEPSHVLLSIGLPHEIAHGSIRLTFSDFSDINDVDYIVQSLKEVVAKLREWSPLG